MLHRLIESTNGVESMQKANINADSISSKKGGLVAFHVRFAHPDCFVPNIRVNREVLQSDRQRSFAILPFL
jgi:hypothetical protein